MSWHSPYVGKINFLATGLGLAACLLLAIGTFCPVVSGPFGGGISFLDVNTSASFGRGQVLMNIAKLCLMFVGVSVLIGCVFAVCQLHTFQIGCGTCALLSTVISWIDVIAAMRDDPALGGALGASVSWSWGWVLLIIGGLLFFAAAITPFVRLDQRD